MKALKIGNNRAGKIFKGENLCGHDFEKLETNKNNETYDDFYILEYDELVDFKCKKCGIKLSIHHFIGEESYFLSKINDKHKSLSFVLPTCNEILMTEALE